MPHLYRIILPVSDIERAQRFYAAVRNRRHARLAGPALLRL